MIKYPTTNYDEFPVTKDMKDSSNKILIKLPDIIDIVTFFH